MTNNARLELNDEHTALLAKYTPKQLRYLLNRLIFPEATQTRCATSAGYPADSANVRASEMGRKDHVRQMLNRCEMKAKGAPEDLSGDMSVDQLIAWHTRMVYNDMASIKEQQASAIELARLKGYHKAAGEQGEQMNVMEELIAMKEAALKRQAQKEQELAEAS